MAKPSRFDLSVYFVADPSVCAGRSVIDVVRQAAHGGLTILQLRDKTGDIPAFLARARALQKILKPLQIPLIINDRVDIALAVNADGVHLGQEDFPPEEARELLGPEKIIGVTAFEERHFRNIDPAIVNYAGTGPFFPTLTKPGKPVLGAAGFKKLVALSPVPVVGVGGITPENAEEVIKVGAAGVAMMRAISESPDPEKAARAFAAAYLRKAS